MYFFHYNVEHFISDVGILQGPLVEFFHLGQSDLHLVLILIRYLQSPKCGADHPTLDWNRGLIRHRI
jgi:hypothetical protein